MISIFIFLFIFSFLYIFFPLPSCLSPNDDFPNKPLYSYLIGISPPCLDKGRMTGLSLKWALCCVCSDTINSALSVGKLYIQKKSSTAELYNHGVSRHWHIHYQWKRKWYSLANCWNSV